MFRPQVGHHQVNTERVIVKIKLCVGLIMADMQSKYVALLRN